MGDWLRHSTLSLRLRVIFSIIMLLVLIGGTFSFLTVRSIHVLIEEVMWENYSHYSRAFAAYAAKSFAEDDIAELQRHLEVALTEQNMIFVLAKKHSGKIVAYSGDLQTFNPIEISRDVYEDESLKVQEMGVEPEGLFHSAGHIFLITTNVTFAGKNIGLIQLAVNTAAANQRLANISAWGFKMAFVVVAFGTLILIFVDRRLKKNIVRLIQITRSMATGDLSQRVDIKTGDEIEHLGESFNMMAEAIKKHEDQLEELVAKRTKEVADEKNKLQLILDNVPSAFLMLDKKLHVQSASAQLETVLNRKRPEVLGKTCALCSLLHESEANCPTHKALRSGKLHSKEAHLTTRSGEDKFVEHIAIPIKRNGVVENVLEIITDITARKRFAEQQLRTEKLSATGEMAAIISHEMRNSLSSVNLILQCLTDSIGKNKEDAKSLAVATESVSRMDSIVSQLLEFSKPTEIKFQTANVSELVKQSLAFCDSLFQRKHIQLIQNLSDDLPSLELDVEQVREVLINLLLNASDAVAEKGVILVKTDQLTVEKTLKDRYEHKSVSLKKGQKVISILVKDNGVGIAPEHFQRIFDPFFTTKTQGTGLGLTMAKRAVGEHGGILFVDSVVDRGSSFTILLPLNQLTS